MGGCNETHTEALLLHQWATDAWCARMMLQGLVPEWVQRFLAVQLGVGRGTNNDRCVPIRTFQELERKSASAAGGEEK